MAKAKKVDKNKDKRALKYFTSATVQAINEGLQDVTLADLMKNKYYFIKRWGHYNG